ncbi:MAG: hypothetical protein JXO49_06720 [Deltaproteobacteria bacterium]|nr:hypothetical protein [Candidatus Anaeroferrophillus wilburensis]MBN2889021.1 hypothetical protein [Deltaproteobacteria bacterium]
MFKKTLSGQDIRSKYITPAILQSGWDLHTQIREEITCNDLTTYFPQGINSYYSATVDTGMLITHWIGYVTVTGTGDEHHHAC